MRSALSYLLAGMGSALFVAGVFGAGELLWAISADAEPRWSGYAPSPVPGLGHTATIDYRGGRG